MLENVKTVAIVKRLLAASFALGLVCGTQFGLSPASAAQISVRLTDAAGAPVPDGVVYAVRLGAATRSATPRPAVIEQKDYKFSPFVSVVQAGTSISFPNRDPVRHHVFSFSAAKTFELKLYGGNDAAPVVFDKAGVVTLGCNVHDWMVGYVLVVDSPYFAKVDAQGMAQLRVAAGDYEVYAWHPFQSGATAPVKLKIAANAAENATFTLALTPRKPRDGAPMTDMKH